MKAEILKILRENQGFVSGQQLCEALGVSRTAVWKSINQLKEEGYQIEAVQNKGYRILDEPDILTKEDLESLLDGETVWAGQQIYAYPSIDSTNLRAKQLGEEGAPHGTLVAADAQEAGRGRKGRDWSSPAGTNIYMSLLLRPDFSPDKASMLTVIMAYSVAKVLREDIGAMVQIKWPNDIICQGKKLAGILTEMNTQIDYIDFVVIGVGINVNASSFPETIQENATSLRMEMNQTFRRGPLVASILKTFETNYEIFEKTLDLSFLKETYESWLVNKDASVTIMEGDQTRQAYALGINEKGELKVRWDDGMEGTVYAGEVSVRGVYGYV